MTGWLGRQNTWLGKKKPAPTPAPAEPPEADMPVVAWHVIRCPSCGSRRVPIYKTVQPVRYHKCEDCKMCFKSVEETV